MVSGNPVIGFIGFGEVAYHFSTGMREAGIHKILGYDRAIVDPRHSELIHKRAGEADAELLLTLKELVARSEVIISAVHGDLALEVANDAAQFMSPGKLFADLNNAAPSAKVQAARLVNAKGAGFVDIGLFETPAQVKHKALMYVSGDGAEEFKTVMSKYGMNIQVVHREAGRATAIKTLANIYIKGVQALCLELGLGAYKAGIDPDLLGSLVVRPVANIPREKQMAFWILRGGLHASRKAAELQSTVETLREWGIDPIMCEATIKCLEFIAQYELGDQFKDEPTLDNYHKILELIGVST